MFALLLDKTSSPPPIETSLLDKTFNWNLFIAMLWKNGGMTRQSSIWGGGEFGVCLVRGESVHLPSLKRCSKHIRALFHGSEWTKVVLLQSRRYFRKRTKKTSKSYFCAYVIVLSAQHFFFWRHISRQVSYDIGNQCNIQEEDSRNFSACFVCLSSCPDTLFLCICIDPYKSKRQGADLFLEIGQAGSGRWLSKVVNWAELQPSWSWCRWWNHISCGWSEASADCWCPDYFIYLLKTSTPSPQFEGLTKQKNHAMHIPFCFLLSQVTHLDTNHNHWTNHLW